MAAICLADSNPFAAFLISFESAKLEKRMSGFISRINVNATKISWALYISLSSSLFPLRKKFSSIKLSAANCRIIASPVSVSSIICIIDVSLKL